MSISEGDLECYRSLKSKLMEQLRHGKINKTGEKGLVGLVNQGATCYLNALLKVLFNIGAFRNAIFQNQNDSRIMSALQKLFGLLSSSKRYAVGTKELTTAFGWSSAEVFDQHDALELFSVLLDVVEKESSIEGDLFAKLFRGSQTDAIKCPSCEFVSETDATYLDIPLHLPEAAGRSHELYDLLKLYSADECLSADNAVECSKCKEKVQATKSVNLKSLPQVVIFNLKRIGFDPATTRRKKISDPVLFPQTIQSADIGAADGNDMKYVLTSVILHNGSATGGHYRAMIRDNQSSAWYEHNDADVSKISEDEEARLFWYHSKGMTDPSPSSTAVSSPGDENKHGKARSSLYEAAYVLVYQREDIIEPQDAKSIPASIVSYVEADNEETEKLQKAYDVYNKQTNLHVSVIGAEAELSAITTVELPIEASLTSATESVYSFVAAARASTGASGLPDMSLCRLRRYERSCHRLGETFGGRESETLAVLGLGVDPTLSGDFVRVPEGCSVALEFRKAEDTFTEFSGKEMQLRVARWAIDADGNLNEAEACVVVVPGEDDSTVEGLRTVAVSSLSFGGDNADIADRLVLMRDTDRGPVVLDDDSKSLKKDCRIYSGGEVLVELLPAGKKRSEYNVDADEERPPVVAALINRKQMIEVLYNIPVAAGDLPEYNLKMSLSSATTLKEFKEKAMKSGALGTVTEFHVRRSATGAQLKNEGKSLDDLGITNQSVIHLQLGPGCAPGEHMIRFEVDITASTDDPNCEIPTLDPLGDFAVKERMSVLQLKEKLVSSWNEIQGANGDLPPPPSAHHIRLRDGKVGAQSGPLRDERAVGKCLLGMSDGRKVIIQVLQNAETIGADDLILFIRLANYEEKLLSGALDIFVPRKVSIQNLCEQIMTKYPKCTQTAIPTDPNAPCPIGIAKAFSTGPPISLKGALKLKWTDDTDARPVDITTVTIDQPPLSIRDGATIVVRDAASFQRAREAARARKEAAGENGALDSTVSPLRGSLRPGSRGGRLRPSTNSRKNREKGVSIGSSASTPMLPPSAAVSTNDDPNAPMIPPISPGKGTPDEGVVVPTAPVRVVKALRGDSVDGGDAPSA